MTKSHKTVRLSSCVSESCPECSTFLDSEELAQNIDHLVNVHGFKLKTCWSRNHARRRR